MATLEEITERFRLAVGHDSGLGRSINREDLALVLANELGDVKAFNKAVHKCEFGRDRVLPLGITPLQPASPSTGSGLD